MAGLNTWVSFPRRDDPASVSSYDSRFSMAEAIAIGAVVKLKSGGPMMTVVYRDTETDKLDCAWFIGTTFQQATFPPGALDVSKP